LEIYSFLLKNLIFSEETLEIAKRKAKQAQDTSDLGTCDDEEHTSKENRKYKSQKVMFSPQISKVRSTSQQVSKPPLFEKIHSNIII